MSARASFRRVLASRPRPLAAMGSIPAVRAPLFSVDVKAFAAGVAVVSHARSCPVSGCRYSSGVSKPRYEAIVVGGGPGGIAAVGNVLDNVQGPGRPLLWVDPDFASGRVGARYREVPSNTKVGLFLQFAEATPEFRRILESASQPNAATALAGLNQDEGCELGYAADICGLLTEGITKHYPKEVRQHRGKVTKAILEGTTKSWQITLDNGHTVTSDRLVLCTGSSPITAPLPILEQISRGASKSIEPIHLDTALKPSVLAQSVDASAPATVGVIGASHSAILVLMNLYRLATTTHPNLRIKWFSRHKKLRYAKYMDGWILYDNTGLKGQAAQWARKSLEDDVFRQSPVSNVVTRFHTPVKDGVEENIFRTELPSCTHVAQAIGYTRDPLPELLVQSQPDETPRKLVVEHDGLTGRFLEASSSTTTTRGVVPYVPNLFGCGIAFPELVTDPAGNVESAVGFWKFMKFLKRVTPEWIEKP